MTTPTTNHHDVAEAEIDYHWEETDTALQLRAVFTFLAGALLLWSQYRAPIDADTQWTRWISMSVWANLILPLTIVWLFFAQTIRHIENLTNQRMNAWNYGWNFGEWKTSLKWASIMIVVMLPLVWWASRDENSRAFYASFYPALSSISPLAFFGSLVLWMFCWEWFFRGFLLFGFAQALPEKWAPLFAIPLQAALFGWAHWGKPMPEFYASFVGGLILGLVAWKQKSWLAPFLVHAAVQVFWALLVVPSSGFSR